MTVADRLTSVARTIAGSTRGHGRATELARIGRVHDLRATPGVLSGHLVQPSGEADVAVAAPMIDDHAWSRLEAGLAESVEHLAALADGSLPPIEILEELLDESLVPAPAEVTTNSEPVLAAAVVMRLATTATHDPSALLAWRGRERETLLNAVRARRGVGALAVEQAAVADPTSSPRGLALPPITLAQPVEPEALVRSLGPAPVAGVADAVRAAAEFAWQIAAGAGDTAASDAVLLAELRGLGTATADDLADRLGMDTEAATVALDELHTQGRVLRAGRRYRAA